MYPSRIISSSFLWAVVVLLLQHCLLRSCHGLPVFANSKVAESSPGAVDDSTRSPVADHSGRRANILPDPEPHKTQHFAPHTGHSAGPQQGLGETSSPAAQSEAEIRGPEETGLQKCRRTKKNHFITVPDCGVVKVNVGQCSGACTTRQRSLDGPELNGDVYRFPVRRGCKCCQTKETEVKSIPVMCDSGLPQVIKVEVVTKCHCQKCN